MLFIARLLSIICYIISEESPHYSLLLLFMFLLLWLVIPVIVVLLFKLLFCLFLFLPSVVWRAVTVIQCLLPLFLSVSVCIIIKWIVAIISVCCGRAFFCTDKLCWLLVNYFSREIAEFVIIL